MVDYITEAPRQLPVLLECDVVVVGGGPAGISAAIGSARAGAHTVLVEQYGCLGGSITQNANDIISWHIHRDTVQPKGLSAEIYSRMNAMDAVYSIGSYHYYDTELYKAMADKLIADYEITPVYHCLATTLYLDDGQVRGVITESKSGRSVILAQRVVDATGEGDVTARAGVPVEKQLSSQPAFLNFFAKYIDLEQLEAAVTLVDGQAPQLPACQGDCAAATDAIYYTPILPTDMNVSASLPDVEIDGTDTNSLSQSEILLRQQARAVIETFHQQGQSAGLSEAEIRTFTIKVQPTVSRRLVAQYALCHNDVQSGAHFEDTIGVHTTHSPLSGSETSASKVDDSYFQIPFQILVPEKVENLLCAGAFVSCDQKAAWVTQSVDFCMVTGQAAGAASALSLRQGVPSAKVDTHTLQQELQRQELRIF